MESKMENNALTEAQRRILAYKDDNTKTGNEILASLSKVNPDKPFEYPVEVKQKIRHINNNLSSIASLAGGRKTKNIMKALDLLQKTFDDLQRFAGDSLESQKVVVDYWLKKVDSIAVSFDRKDRPWQVDFGINLALQDIRARISID